MPSFEARVNGVLKLAQELLELTYKNILVATK